MFRCLGVWKSALDPQCSAHVLVFGLTPFKKTQLLVEHLVLFGSEEFFVCVCMVYYSQIRKSTARSFLPFAYAATSAVWKKVLSRRILLKAFFFFFIFYFFYEDGSQKHVCFDAPSA